MAEEYILAKYLRISEDDGQYGDSQSIEGQLALLDDFVEAHPELRTAKALEFVEKLTLSLIQCGYASI